MKGFGERIRRARMEMGLTQKQLADETGVSQTVISAWERNKRCRFSKSVFAIVDRLDVTFDWLFGRTEEKSVKNMRFASVKR